jgi:D-hydroxyproline dehydrogenase subunit alpha
MTEADVVVIGAGPAGIAAAAQAADAGARTVVIDEAPLPGGQIWRHTDPARAPAAARPWLERLRGSGATLMNGASVVHIEEGRRLLVEDRSGGALQIDARAIIIATGARELWLPFPGWTLPGVVGVGGAQALLKSGMAVHGKRVLIAGTGPLLFPVAAAYADAGADVVEVLEQAPRGAVLAFGASLARTPRRLLDAARYRRSFARAPLRLGEWVVRAHGDTHVTHATVSDGMHQRTVPCDVLAVSHGLVPSTELARLVGCEIAAGAVRVDAQQRTSVRSVFAAGEPTGVGGVDRALIEGRIAGLAAAGREPPATWLAERRRHERFRAALERAFALRAELRRLAEPDTVVCRCEDVPFERVAACSSMREAKLVTRAGMGACQGRVCGAAMHHLFGWDADAVRIPVLPAAVATLMTDEPRTDAAGEA